jgi:hypothetical protein
LGPTDTEAPILSDALGLISKYFQQGWAIARLRKEEIRRAAADPMALFFGLAFVFISQLLLAGSVAVLNLLAADAKSPVQITMGKIFAFVGITTLYMLFFLLILHGVVKKVFRGQGEWGGIVRPVLLGSVVMWLCVIPLIGMMAGTLWWGFGVVPGSFRELHGISFGQALLAYIITSMALSVLAALMMWGFV